MKDEILMGNMGNMIKKGATSIWGRKNELVMATFLQGFCWFLALSLYGYIVEMPRSVTLGEVAFPAWLTKNWMGTVGGYVAHYLLREYVGISALFVPLLPFCISLKLFAPKRLDSTLKVVLSLVFLLGWSTLAISYCHYVERSSHSLWYMLPSRLGMQLATYLGSLLGGGVILLLGVSLISFVIILSFDRLSNLKKRLEKGIRSNKKSDVVAQEAIAKDTEKVTFTLPSMPSEQVVEEEITKDEEKQ